MYFRFALKTAPLIKPDDKKIVTCENLKGLIHKL
jgi:hypothetical protein